MNCKNHNEREGTVACSVCGGNFCEECVDLETNQCNECKIKDDISKDILNDILSNVDLPSKAIANFDPTDILKQIEEEITLKQEFERLDFDISSEMDNSKKIEKLNFSSEGITAEENKNSMDLNLLVEGFVSDDINLDSNVDSVISSTVAETTIDETIAISEDSSNIEEVIITEDTIVENITENIEETTIETEVSPTHNSTEESSISNLSKIKEKVLLTKDVVAEKASTFDTENAKESVKSAANSTKNQASKLSKEAKLKTAGVAAGVATGAALTKEKAVDVKNSAKEKMEGSKKEMDSILNKIKEENANGEYDHLLGRFTTTYGQDKKTTSDGDEQSALPLRINSIIYFLASLIPGAAQLYLGLTTRGITILLIGSCFFFITNTASLFIITAMLSFADAYKLRNIYHRGGKIEDTNSDIMTLIKNPIVIIMAIVAIIFGIM